MIASQIGSMLISAARSGASNLAVPVRYSFIKASAIFAAGLFFSAAIGCLTSAIWLFSIPYWGQPNAALIAGAFLFLVGIAVLGIGSLVLKQVARPLAVRQTDQVPLLVNQIVKDQKGALLLAALVAGMVVSENQRKR